MTYSDTIQNALQLIGVLAESESVSAEQGANAIVVLNDMMAHWESLGIYLGHVPPDNLASTMTYPQNARIAIKANLAVLLCPIYGREPPALVIAMASAGFNQLLIRAVNEQAKPTSLGSMTAIDSVSTILTGP